MTIVVVKGPDGKDDVVGETDRGEGKENERTTDTGEGGDEIE